MFLFNKKKGPQELPPPPEIGEELDAHVGQKRSFFDETVESHYSPDDFLEFEKFDNMMGQMSDSIEGISHEPQGQESARKEIMDAVSGVKSRKAQMPGRPYQENQYNPTPKDDSIGVDAINRKITQARDCIANLDLESAKRIYIEVMKSYNSLGKAEQSKVYGEIMELYSERKNAEQYKR